MGDVFYCYNLYMNEYQIEQLRKFLKKEKIKFKNIETFINAFTHPSYLHDNGDATSYERLEFLGDSILGYVVSKYLYDNFPTWDEGKMTKAKSKYVSGKFLCQLSKEMQLDKYIITGRSVSELQDSMYENIFEALLGAIIIESGIKKAEIFIGKYLLSKIK